MGYNNHVTGDHSMNEDSLHSGNTPYIPEVSRLLLGNGISDLVCTKIVFFNTPNSTHLLQIT